MLARLPVCLLALLFTVPSALAFSASHDPVSLQYDAAKAPIILATGQLSAGGVLRGGLLAAGLAEADMGPIPRLSIAETGNGTPRVTNLSGATVTIHRGAIAWKIDDSSADLRATAPYGFGLALPRSPFDGDSGAARSSALVMAGPVVFGNVSWVSGEVTLVPLDAVVSIRASNGSLVWDHQAVNAKATLQDADQRAGSSTLLVAGGAFDARLVGQALVAGLGSSAQQMRVEVRQGAEDRFLETIQAVGNATALIGDAKEGSGGDPFGNGLPDQLQAISPVFNGAVLVLPGASGGEQQNDSAPATPLESTIGGKDVDIGPFAMLRSQDLALQWGDGRVGVQGTSAMTVTRAGFQTPTPLTLGLVPLVSVLLWLGAIAAVVVFLVKRPPKADGSWPMRIVSWLVWAVVLVAVFWWWDRSFAETFGTSILTVLKQRGLSGQSYSQLGLLFGIEMIPWGIAGLLFALPVRIILGVALRYRGQGSSFKRVAAAGGLVSLAIFGPIYALWIVNVMIKELVAYAPKLFGG